MAKVEWSAGIDSVSGALSKPGKNGQHSCSKMLLGTHRVAPTESSDCNRIYLRKKTKRATALSTKEIAARTRFATVKAAVDVRRACMAQQFQAYRPGYQCAQERPEPCSRGSGGVQCAERHRRRIQDHASVSVARLCRRDQRLTSTMESFVSQQLSTIIQNFSFCR